MTDRKRLAAALMLVLLTPAPNAASVVITSTLVTLINGKTTRLQLVHTVDGTRMHVQLIRPDEPGRQGLVDIYDSATGRIVFLDLDKQQAEVHAAPSAAAQVEKDLASELVTVDLKATGRARELLGARCEEYTFMVRAPLTGGATLVRSGSAWIAREAPGVDEYVAFFRGAGSVLVGGSVRMPKTVLAVDRTDTELYRRLAGLGGIPYAMEMKLEVEGTGLAARMLRGALTWSEAVTTTAVDTSAVPEVTFAIPAGWKTRLHK